MIKKNIISFLIIVAIIVSGCDQQPRIPFDKNTWQTNESIRYQMLDHLVESRLLQNKRSSEILSILGEPNYRWDSLAKWSYSAGSAPAGLGFGFYYLIVKFKDGTVDSTIINEYID